MDYKEELARAKDLLLKAQEIRSDPESPAEELEKADRMVEEATKLRERAAKQLELTKAIKDVGVLENKAQTVADDQQENEPEVVPSDYEGMGEFLHSIWLKDSGRFDDPRLQYFKDDDTDTPKESVKDLERRGWSPEGAKQMVESVGASGGFLVPTEFLAQLQMVDPEDVIVRPRATVIRMRRRQIDLPVLDQTGTTAGRPHWFGGMRFFWAEEAAAKTLTEADFRKVSLVAHKLIGYTRASDELLDDSAISLNDFITGPLGFAGGVSWTEDYEFIRGTGVGQPLGVINAGATIVVARNQGGTINYIDLTNMLESFLPSARGLWSCTQSGLSNLMQIVDPNGNYIWQPNAREGVPQQIFGFPVVFTEKQPAVGTQGDILLCDWRYYLIGDRQATTIESTKFDYWRYDQTSWRVVHRVDGQPWLNTWLTYDDGATTVSPFVMLGAKST